MDKEIATVFVAAAGILIIILGAILADRLLRNACVDLLQAKPAIEIQLVCK